MERLMVDQIKEEPKTGASEVFTQKGDAQGDLVKDAEGKGMIDGVRIATEKLNTLQPQDEKQVTKKNWLQKVGGVLGLYKTPEELEVIGIEAIKAHAAKSQMYNQYLKEDAGKASLYAQAVGSDPDIKYWGWDEKKGKFVSTGSFGVASGEGSGGK